MCKYSKRNSEISDPKHIKDLRTRDVTLWGTLNMRMESLRTFTITCSTLLVTYQTTLQPETDLHAKQKLKLRLSQNQLK